MKKIESVMSGSVLSVRWSYPVKQAQALMEERNVRHLPVVGDDGLLVGILSDRDVKRAMDPQFCTIEDDAKVGDFMNWPVLSVERSTPLVKAIDLLIHEKISSLVITQGQAVVGIVTTEDLMRVLRDFLLREEDPAKLELSHIPYTPVFQEAVRELGAAGV